MGEAFKGRTAKNVVGDPFASDTFQGPQVSKLQFDRIMNYIQAGKDAGAKVETGGDRHGKEGYFIQPTIFSGVSEDMKIMQEEIFGPVCSISKFETEDEVIRPATRQPTVSPLLCTPLTSTPLSVSPTLSRPAPSGSTATTCSLTRFLLVASRSPVLAASWASMRCPTTPRSSPSASDSAVLSLAKRACALEMKKKREKSLSCVGPGSMQHRRCGLTAFYSGAVTTVLHQRPRSCTLNNEIV